MGLPVNKIYPYSNDEFKNGLINGGMDYWQRVGTAAASNLTGSMAFYADRWQFMYTGSYTGTPDVLAQTNAWGNQKGTGTATFLGNASAANASIHMQQKIERLVAKRYAGKKISISMSCYSESANQVTLNLYYANTLNVFSPNTAITVPDSTKTFSLGLFQDRTIKWEGIDIPTNAENGLIVYLTFSNWTITGLAKYLAPGRIMLNRGDLAMPFDYYGANYEDELRACQRYFEKSWEINLARTTSTVYHATHYATDSVHRFSSNVDYQVTKRVIPVVQTWDGSGNAGQASLIATGSGSLVDGGVAAQPNKSERSFSLQINGGAVSDGRFFFKWTADAEF